MGNKLLYEFFHKRTKPLKRAMDGNNFTYRNIFELLGKYCSRHKTFLDIGCGSGSISLFLASQGKEILGIDISKISVDACRKGSKKLGLDRKTSFRVMDFPEQKPNKKFDVVICSEVLEHIENENKALKLIYNLLNKNGLLIISVPSVNAPLHKLGFAKKFDARVGHLRRYSLDWLVNLCEGLGFIILENKKTEGVLRNFLFLNPIAGKIIKFIRGPVVGLVTALDNISLRLFGESQIFVVAQKK